MKIITYTNSLYNNYVLNKILYCKNVPEFIPATIMNDGVMIAMAVSVTVIVTLSVTLTVTVTLTVASTLYSSPHQYD